MSDTNQTNEIPSYMLKKKRGSMTSWRGNKYPEVKLRGFYSDITSEQNVDKTHVSLQRNRKTNVPIRYKKNKYFILKI